MDKSLMLNKIRDYYKFDSDVEFAKHLGIKPNVLANWRKRNTLNADLIFTKCDEISLTWLVTGKGEMLIVNSTESIYDNYKIKKGMILNKPIAENPKDPESLQKIIDLQDRLLKSREEYIKILEEERQRYYGK